MWHFKKAIRVSGCTVDAPFLLAALPVVLKLWSGPLLYLVTGLLYLLGELVFLEISHGTRKGPCFEVCMVLRQRSCPAPFSLMFTCCILSPTFCFQTFLVLLCKSVSCFCLFVCLHSLEQFFIGVFSPPTFHELLVFGGFIYFFSPDLLWLLHFSSFFQANQVL